MKKLKWFLGNDNPLWMWMLSAMMLTVSTWIMYLAWGFAYARGDYLAMLVAVCVFSLPFAWLSYMSAKQAMYLHKYHSDIEFRNRQDLNNLTQKRSSLEYELQKTNERIAELSR